MLPYEPVPPTSASTLSFISNFGVYSSAAPLLLISLLYPVPLRCGCMRGMCACHLRTLLCSSPLPASAC